MRDAYGVAVLKAQYPILRHFSVIMPGAPMIRFGLYSIVVLFFALSARTGTAQQPVVEAITIDQLQQLLHDHEAALTVVNVWATWCAPCLEEFPAFVQLGKDLAHQGVTVFFVSMDVEDEKPAVEAFLAKQGYSDTSYLRVGKDHAFISTMHEAWTGVLPATFLYKQNGSLVDFWQGTPVAYDVLKERVVQALQP